MPVTFKHTGSHNLKIVTTQRSKIVEQFTHKSFESILSMSGIDEALKTIKIDIVHAAIAKQFGIKVCILVLEPHVGNKSGITVNL
ncbi:hypothetical protein D3C81_921820 [compost metagenome]